MVFPSGLTAAVRRPWGLWSLVPFMAVLAAVYTLYFAGPRYRIPIEALAQFTPPM